MRDRMIKKLIIEGHMITYEIRSFFVSIVMIIYFDNHLPVLLTKRKWKEYWEILDNAEKG